VPIFLGGMWVGGQILSTPAYGHPPYAYYPAAAPGAGPRNCWTEQRNIEGRMRTVQVCY
jgi:hypothetical protein